MHNITKAKSVICIIAAASLWGLISLFNTILTGCGFTQLEIVFVRAFTALIVTFIYVYIKDKKLFNIKLRDVWCFIGSGILSLLFFNICYFYAMQENIMVAAVLLYTSPAFVMIFSYFLFNEKFTLVKLLALLLMLTGCAFVTGLISSATVIVSELCIIFGIGSGIGYALYSIFGRYALNKGYSSETITFYTFLFAAFGNLPLISLSDIASKITFNAVFGAIGIGVVCCFLPYLLYTKGLCGVNNGQASVMSTIEPVVASFVSVALGDSFGWNSAVGILLVISSIAVINRES